MFRSGVRCSCGRSSVLLEKLGADRVKTKPLVSHTTHRAKTAMKELSDAAVIQAKAVMAVMAPGLEITQPFEYDR